MSKVAEIAGVSSQTVARVLNQSGYVKQSTRDAVLEAIRQTGYRPNLFARSLRTQRSSILGFVSESARNPFFTKLGEAVQMEALHRGFTVLTLNHNQNLDAERLGVQQFIDHQVGAIIFAAARAPETVKMAVASGIAVLQLEREVASAGNAILVDPVPGMRMAVSHLASIGHRRIGYIGGEPIPDRSELPVEQSNEVLRLVAFRACIQEAGLSVDDDLIGLGTYFDPADGLPVDGERLMRAMTDRHHRPSAVVIGSDLIAAGAIQAVYTAGLRVPDDISIIGYDNSFSALLSPPLTTIAQPLEELGKLAIAQAIQLANGDRLAERITTLPTSFVIRRSTGPAR